MALDYLKAVFLKRFKHLGHTAYMVGVRMRCNHKLKFLYTVFLEIVDNCIAVTSLTCIYEHGMRFKLYKYTY